jgi:D-alanine-D-alanine ligase
MLDLAKTSQTIEASGYRKRTRVAVMFGGKSVEHEISVITGLQFIRAIDVVEYEPIPLYIAATGKWYTGTALLDQSFYKKMPASLDSVDEVILLPIPNIGGLKILKRSDGSKSSSYASEEDLIPIDIYAPIFHGTYGEDGCMQGLLELAEVPYTGSGVLASALSMSKRHCKDVVSQYGVPVLPSKVVTREAAQEDLGKGLIRVTESILATKGFEKFPLFVKPCTLGSSVGVARATNIQELDAALLQAFKYDPQALVEPCIDRKSEINVSVLDAAQPYASVTEIPVASSEVLSYEDKYLKGGSKKTGNEPQGMAALTRIIDPPDLSEEIKTLARGYAVDAFIALGCSGVARIDFMLDLSNGNLYFNEINPIPGSLSFYLWERSHPPVLYTDLITRILKRAEKLYQEKTSVIRDFGFHALAK